MRVELESAKRIRAVIENINNVTGESDATLADAVDTLTARFNTAHGDGERAEYDRFWDEYQDGGNRRNYWGAFAGWSDAIFKPKYPIIASTVTSLLYGATITKFPTIDCTACATLANMASWCYTVESIEAIILKSTGGQSFSNCFAGCDALKEIRFEGVISESISFDRSSRLSRESIESVFSALSDSTSGKTLTLSKTALESAFGSNEAEEWRALRETKPSWTIAAV